MPKERTDDRQGAPYGPTQGIVDGLALLQRLSPARVDTALLRQHKIAPGNEYKVVGALKFLGVIDNEGAPLPYSRLLKTRGATLTQTLREILRNAYADLFSAVDLLSASRQDVYNFFVTAEGLGAEMAQKATRSFLELCRRAEVPLSAELQERPRRGRPPRSPGPSVTQSSSEAPERASRGSQEAGGLPNMAAAAPFVLTITPEMASMDEEALTELFRKLRAALRRSAEE